MPRTAAIVPVERIESHIVLLRGHKVMLDADLAGLYGVETKALTRAVRRNLDRFPHDFMFQLQAKEFASLRRQFGASSQWGGRRYRPYAFTEQGRSRESQCHDPPTNHPGRRSAGSSTLPVRSSYRS